MTCVICHDGSHPIAINIVSEIEGHRGRIRHDPGKTVAATISIILANFVFGVLGLYIIGRGRIHGNITWIVLGAILVGFGYLVSDPILIWIVGAGLLAITYKSR